jgi:hypothetical protein
MSRIDVIDLELTVIKADGLAAKDTNFFGEWIQFDYFLHKWIEIRLTNKVDQNDPTNMVSKQAWQPNPIHM